MHMISLQTEPPVHVASVLVISRLFESSPMATGPVIALPVLRRFVVGNKMGLPHLVSDSDGVLADGVPC